jgi:hypothetical protein
MWKIFGKKSISTSASHTACAIFAGPQESKLLHSCSPLASDVVCDCSSSTENPSSAAKVTSHGMCPSSAPTFGIPITRAPGRCRTLLASRAARCSNGLGASFSSFGWLLVEISNFGQAPPETATRLCPSTEIVVRSIGQSVWHCESRQRNSLRPVISAARISLASSPGAAASASAPICSAAHKPMPHAPMAPGFGGTTISQPVTAASVQASDGLDAGLPWKKTRFPSVRWPMTRFR